MHAEGDTVAPLGSNIRFLILIYEQLNHMHINCVENHISHTAHKYKQWRNHISHTTNTYYQWGKPYFPSYNG